MIPCLSSRTCLLSTSPFPFFPPFRMVLVSPHLLTTIRSFALVSIPYTRRFSLPLMAHKCRVIFCKKPPRRNSRGAGHVSRPHSNLPIVPVHFATFLPLAMAHARKESLGTAASLFGDTSGDTDFFSSLQQAPVADDNAHRQLSQPTDSAPDLATSSSQSQDDAAGLFGSTEGASAWDQSLYEASADQHQMAAGASYDYGAGAGQADATQDAYASQGWYDDDGQWHYYSEVDSQNWPSTAAAQGAFTSLSGSAHMLTVSYPTHV